MNAFSSENVLLDRFGATFAVIATVCSNNITKMAYINGHRYQVHDQLSWPELYLFIFLLSLALNKEIK